MGARAGLLFRIRPRPEAKAGPPRPTRLAATLARLRRSCARRPGPPARGLADGRPRVRGCRPPGGLRVQDRREDLQPIDDAGTRSAEVAAGVGRVDAAGPDRREVPPLRTG